ncbi:VPLPA-CTERM sorting domain-containing protein [Jannaschia sp. LMIT008]|uniref:VPLPA-CTERM sorting domain-containing protein n=1 Tax=Jannaschia maritima TaxID=3032585 RepID=UPI002811DEA4|nr:VPLPA-CTERM sorting domain-containing protein [Jannaschia sp. LMIT008]
MRNAILAAAIAAMPVAAGAASYQVQGGDAFLDDAVGGSPSFLQYFQRDGDLAIVVDYDFAFGTGGVSVTGSGPDPFVESMDVVAVALDIAPPAGGTPTVDTYTFTFGSVTGTDAAAYAGGGIATISFRAEEDTGFGFPVLSATVAPLNPIPLPAAGILLLGALGAVAGLRRLA